MDFEPKIRQAVREELRRQAEVRRSELSVDDTRAGSLTLNGRIDLDELVMAIAGALAGGP